MNYLGHAIPMKMKKPFLLLLAACTVATAAAQTGEVPATPEPLAISATPATSAVPAATAVTGTPATAAAVPEFPEPEFMGQVLAIRPDDTTEQLVQESLTPRHRSSTGQKLFGIGKDHIDEMTLNGPRAYVRFRAEDGIAFIVRVPDNRIDPMSMISVFRFKVKKKMRIAEYGSVGTFGDRKSNTLERQPFTSRRFGGSSYLIVLKGVEPGEYGITVDALGGLTVSTFGVDE